MSDNPGMTCKCGANLLLWTEQNSGNNLSSIDIINIAAMLLNT
ncbi:hypothetical protein Mpsy_2715 [Methanolobus psychrophilus R15]|nr:hypothetical protein Mpsy_2715 [Methanolobus psychrophilus R15]